MLLFGGKTLDKQLEHRPEHVTYCTKCVVSNQRPRITFDDKGVCSACHYAHEKHNVIDWNEREKMLVDLLDRYRSKDGSYDCIVPGSGGKDSGYVAHQLKYVYGMHPLTVTWAPHIYTDIGWKNYLAFKDSGFDNVLVFPNGVLHRKLSKVAFELWGDHFKVFGLGQKALAFHMSVKFGIPLVFYGESGEIEYGGSTKNKGKPYEDVEDWSELYFAGSSLTALTEEGLRAGVFTKQEVEHEKFSFYWHPPLDQLRKIDAQMHWFSYYKKWVPQENYYYTAEHTGFQANPVRSEGTYSKYASLDDKTDGFHFYLGFVKFGIGRATSDAAHEIRDGHITREEGISLVHRYDGEFPKKYFPEFLEYLKINEEEFWEVIDLYRTMSPHLWDKSSGQWVLKHRVK
ncbi:MAG TPA: N-acetyl sugar amidotransferase [Elusimicrobiota bacterium]|nr:N-acetyl sugar amidotransferase [Elusimicrobiota bacterium]